MATITGTAGDDTLVGTTVADTLIGLGGNDIYTVDNVGDVLTEVAAEGIDTANASVSYTLASEVENLNLTGTSAINGTGNVLDNAIIGNAAVNILSGGAGNDTLDGGIGADTLVGGLGNDVYIVDNVGDVVTELVGEGNDIVRASITYTLAAEVETLELTGLAAINATGNILDNVITGNRGNNTLIGGAGNDTLDGGLGTDTLIGGVGNDTYIINDQADAIVELGGEGVDTVQASVTHTLAAEVENITLTGAAIINATGNVLANTMIGNTAANILDGRAGADTMTGGIGDDTYVVDNAGDVVVEVVGEGIDTVRANLSYVLGADVDNLILTGNAALNGEGNALDNTIVGNRAVNTMTGHAGNDTYYVDNVGDVIVEVAGEGTADTIVASIDYVLGAEIENLTLTGLSPLTGTGNASVNVITGNAGNNTLDGLVGADTMIGGIGDDVFIVDDAADVTTELDGEGKDTVRASASHVLGGFVEDLVLTGVGDINATGNGLKNFILGNDGNNIIDGGAEADVMNGGAGNDTYVVDDINDVLIDSAGTDTVQSDESWALGKDFENLELMGSSDINATGNNTVNILTGNSGNNTLDGGLGNDTMTGGAGNDTYVLDNINDVIVENAAEGDHDTVKVGFDYTLLTDFEDLVLTGDADIDGEGNDADNTLTGNAGINMLTGGIGNDTYYIDSALDSVVELAGEGTDTVVSTAINYTLAAEVENLTLGGELAINGTGNALDNTMTGNVNGNILTGGLGNDYYLVDHISDLVVENAGQGTDTVEASISYTLAANVENLVLTDTFTVNGTGNALDNTITGNDMANTLDGKAGDDTMDGGTGDDTFIVDSLLDVVIDSGGEDTVRSSVTYVLGTDIENLVLTGNAAIDGTGHAGDNTITGNAAINTLTGGDGNDVYIIQNSGAVIVENAAEGTEDEVQSSVSYALSAEIEKITLTGTAAINATGNALDNIIFDNAGLNTLTGGLGNDTYHVRNTNDKVVELTGQGTDIVYSTASSYALSNFIEELILDGDANIGGAGNDQDNTITGNTGNNYIKGNGGVDTLLGDAGADTLDGGNGNDTLDGGSGADTMVGGNGNDVFLVDDVGDIATDTSGIDRVDSTVSYVLGNGIENLTLLTAAANGTGNAVDNTITGNDADNTLDGGIGKDTLIGATGQDMYIVDNIGDVVIELGAQTNTGRDYTFTIGTHTITLLDNDFDKDIVESSVTYTIPFGVEFLRLTGTANINAFGSAQSDVLIGNTGVNTLAGGLGNDLYIITDLRDILVEAANAGIDEAAVTFSYTLSATSNIENIDLIEGSGAINATGNAKDNYLQGNDSKNTLNGAAGNDFYEVTTDDVIIDSSGIDTVVAKNTWILQAGLENLFLHKDAGTANATGNASANEIYGNESSNTLDGGLGADYMEGGEGDDTYVIDNIGDSVYEAFGEGTDTIIANRSYVLGGAFEHLTLSGTANINGQGNAQANTIIGNLGINVLRGGLGDDVYFINNAASTVVENAAEGTDVVYSNTSFVLGLANEVEVLTLLGTTNINLSASDVVNTITGNSGNNVIRAFGGDDTITGGAGIDTLIGGLGNDTYYVDNSKDVLTEIAGEGVDIAFSSAASYTLGAEVEDLTLEEGGITGIGNALDNTITGNAAKNTLNGSAGNDVLDGDAGADVMDGGLGDDTYMVDDSKDIVKDISGTDTVMSAVNYVLGVGIENLNLISGDINGTGNSLDNVIIGTVGNNTLDGGLGIDTMDGGDGDDTYIVDNYSDVIIDATGTLDTVRASMTYVLADGLENLVLTGVADINGTGNASNNILTGNTGVNILEAGAGNDTLDGGLKADTMYGGAGDDIYYIDIATDTIVEFVTEGVDKIVSAVNYTLVDEVENLTLSGAKALIGTGNVLDNILTGSGAANTLLGLAGTDTLDGGAGIDKMFGGTGNDTYIVDNVKDLVTEVLNEGTDTVRSSVTYTLTTDVENLVLTGETNLNGTGNAAANTLIGNIGNNTLNGLVGADTMLGGEGNDTYIVDNAADLSVEYGDEGTDVVMSSVTYALYVNTEKLVLTGTAAINGTGSDTDNHLVGNNAINTLTGLDGNDTLDGGLGVDTLVGGLGNDLYYVDNILDVVTEVVNEGIDTVSSTVTYTLVANVDNITLTGKAALQATGNALDNVMIGNTASNSLSGGLGNDTLNGGAGGDRLTGGLGDDLYMVDSTGDIIIEGVGEGVDSVQSTISHTLAINLENLTLMGIGKTNATGNALGNTLTGNAAANIIDGKAGADTMFGGNGNDTFYADDLGDEVYESSDEGTDIVMSSVSFTLGANVENLTLAVGTTALNGTGNASANIINGNAGNNIIDGGTGVDTMNGGAGNDTYYVDEATDKITDTSGVDSVISTAASYVMATGIESLTLQGIANINATGNAAANTLTGNIANNTLDGGAGIDRLVGGLGDDTYIVDVLGDVIIENGGEGTDTVIATGNYTLSSVEELENLTLSGKATTGTGNALDNLITGSALANNLYGLVGNDTLNGGAGVDKMYGGVGNDSYYVDDARDVVIELAAEGTDIVYAKATYTLGLNVETLVLTGTTGLEALNGTGNAGNNTLQGNDGNNTLNGGLGIDSLIGGVGNDVYIIDNVADVIVENVGEGTDTAQASVTYTIGANVETLVLTGTTAINGTGNADDNSILGNAAINILTGAAGNDTLNGGVGADTLIGGLGDDLYYVDNVGDVVTEAVGEGIDLVSSSVNYTLGADVDNLTLTLKAISGTGNALDNVIIGTASANTLTGAAGNDTLDGGAGADRLIGGLGDDLYIIDSKTDLAVEGVGEGTDTVRSSQTYILLTNFENLTLTGALAINATGNAVANTLIGNAGANIIDGKAGIDTMIGGAGNDTYYVADIGDVVTENASEGTDIVNSTIATYALTADVENLTLVMGSSAITGTGNALNNIINGNAGNNTLDGGLGIDTLNGGAGNDTYFVDDTSDKITDTAGTLDVVFSTALTYTLANGLERLELSGISDISGTGNTVANVIIGNAGDNTLDGGAGADTLIGGDGSDFYVIDNVLDVITENLNEGTDTVQSKITHTLGTHFENLTLLGTTGIAGTGNASDNTITGNAGANVLSGGAGSDVFYSLDGADTITGGADDDIFVFEAASAYRGIDKITDFDVAENDVLDIRDLLTSYAPGIDDLNDFVRITETGGNSVLQIDRDGAGTAFKFTQIALLQGVTGLTDVDALELSGHLIVV